MLDRVGVALKRIGNQPADIYLDATGNLAMVRNAEAVGQHTRQRLMTFYGEWFLDNQAGVPWIGKILGESYDPALAEGVIKSVVMDTDGVTEITSFDVKFDRQSRNLTAFDIEIGTEYSTEVRI